MKGLTGLGPIDLEEEESDHYSRMMKDRQAYSNQMDEEPSEPTQAPRRFRRHNVSVESDSDKSGYEPPPRGDRQAHLHASKQYKNMKEEQVESDEEGLHEPDRKPEVKGEGYDWGGPDEGDDKDQAYLNDERGQRTTGDEDDDYDNPDSYLHAPESNRRGPDEIHRSCAARRR